MTADLAVISAHGFFGTSAITALTVQSTTGVRRVSPVDASLLAETIDCLVEDMPPAGIKIGMLASLENVLAVAKFLERLRIAGSTTPVVLDPVLRSSSGAELLSAAGVQAIRRELLHLVTWITPNMDELAVLAEAPVETEERMEAEAIWMADEWCDLGVAATGGHLPQPSDFAVEPGGKSGGWFPSERIETRATHGTGCAFSTALLCGLVAGLSGLSAVEHAQTFVRQGIRRAPGLGSGNGPLDLLWPLRRSS